MSDKITQAVRILKVGGVVVFPTETVYGLGARMLDKMGVWKIYFIKGRPPDNPLIVHVGRKEELKTLAKTIPPAAEKLIQKFWPGPLTLIFKKTSIVPAKVTAGLKTVAVRMPSHPMALQLLRTLKEPIAAPSANPSGRPSPTRSRHVKQELRSKVDLVLEGGKSKYGLESTVLDVTQTPFRILRPGFVTLEDLKKVVPNIVAADHPAKEPAMSPGTKHRHYVPSCKVIVVPPHKWESTLKKWKKNKTRLGILSLTQKIPDWKNVIFKKTLHNPRHFAAHLYDYFFEAEKANVQVLLVESTSTQGVGLALMDRLSRASA